MKFLLQKLVGLKTSFLSRGELRKQLSLRELLMKRTFFWSSRSGRRGVVIGDEEAPHMHQEILPGVNKLHEFNVIVVVIE